MSRWALVIVMVLALQPREAVADQPAAPTFQQLLAAHTKAQLSTDSLVKVHPGVGKRIQSPAVYVTVTSTVVLLYGATLVRLNRGQLGTQHLRHCKRSVCAPMIRNAVAAARSRLAYKTGTVPRVLVFADSATAYGTLLIVLRSIGEAGAALSVGLVARTGARRLTLVELPVWIWPGRRIVADPASQAALMRVDISNVHYIVSGSRRYSQGPQRVLQGGELEHALGRLQLASGRKAVFVSAMAHTVVGRVIETVVQAQRPTLGLQVILTRPGEGVYAVP